MEPKGSSSISSDRKTNKMTLASSAHARPNRKSTASSAMVMKPNGKSAVSSAILMKPNASTAPSSAHGDQVMFFRDVSLSPTEADLRFRLIHLWEARNPSTKTLIGQEMILIDEEGTVIQGFVPAGRVGTYELEPGSVYNLRNFFGSKNKAQYRVTDHSATVTFAWNSNLSILDNPPVLIHEDRFRFHSYDEFQANLFMDNDVQPSRDYLGWLSSNSDLANKINAEVVNKPETATLEELFAYIKQETAKVAWFECTATIDDVLPGFAWYYISCGGCNSKAVKGPNSLICNNKKCGKSDVTGVAQYLTRISVYDKSEQAVFVILGDAGKELTGKHASELVASYFEANEGVVADHCVRYRKLYLIQ
ncbi:unnamed protein product [Brassica napus]|uniref:(rape) hypothetical protein n=1 Tax=Brassica napus TaxID=3708 RepID=A0A816I9G0_BRANA|nr:unnamed protein product [Brassica napus]